VSIDDDKQVPSARGRIWACNTWGMTKLYAKSQLLQANMFEKKAVLFLQKENEIKSGSGGVGVMHLNTVEWVGQVSLDDALLT
jgi:hypothetical protein